MKLSTRLLLSVPLWGAAAVFLLGTWYAFAEPWAAQWIRPDLRRNRSRLYRCGRADLPGSRPLCALDGDPRLPELGVLRIPGLAVWRLHGLAVRARHSGKSRAGLADGLPVTSLGVVSGGPSMQ